MHIREVEVAVTVIDIEYLSSSDDSSQCFNVNEINANENKKSADARNFIVKKRTEIPLTWGITNLINKLYECVN